MGTLKIYDGSNWQSIQGSGGGTPGIQGVTGMVGPAGPQGATGIGGGTGDLNVDGGTANSVYLPSQIINGGAA